MPITIITTKARRKDDKPRYRARWTNPYERGAKPVYKVHWDTAWLREWGRQMDAAARDAKLNPQPLPTPERPVAERMTFAELVDAWRATRLASLQARSVVRYEGIVRNYLLPAWGSRTLASIDRECVKRYLAALRQRPCQVPHPPAFGQPGHTHTVAQAHKVQIVASSIFSEGIDLGYLDANPASRVKLPQPDHQDMLYLTEDELRAVAEAIDPRYRVLTYLAGHRGPRASELWALRRQDVDVLNRRLHIRRALKRTYGPDKPDDAPLFGMPKNGRPRSFKLPHFLTNMLSAHLETIPPSPTTLVFTAPEGGVVRHELFKRRFWTPALERCVAADTLPAEKAALRFHDTRHTAASIMAKNGYTLEQVREVLGHRDIRTTLRYQHLFEGHQDPLLDQEDAAYEANERKHRRLHSVENEAA